MRSDIPFLLPAFFIALYQIILWRRLKGNDVAIINGKYKLSHFLAFIVIKYSTYFVLIYQIFFNLFRITDESSIYLYVLGYTFVILGFFISISAIKELGKNWDNMMFYKITPNHKLIKTGVYHYTRHPVYFALILEVLGYQLIANSWLAIFFLITSSIVLIRHIKNEEELLEIYFGKEYSDYKNSTKKLIPFI